MRTWIIRGVGLCMLLVAVPVWASMEGLVGAWLFDEGNGQIAHDASGNGFDAELVGNAAWDAAGRYGSAVATDGTEAYVMVADNEAFEFDDDFTIACWVKIGKLPSDHSGLVTKGYDKPANIGGNAKPWYLLYLLTSGTVDLYLRTEQDVNSRAVGQTPIGDGQWHHVVGMKDGNKVKVYIDGQEDGVADAVDATYGANDQPLVFMVHYHRWFPGLLDEVAIFDRALREDEIAKIMNGLGDVLAVAPQGKLATVWARVRTQ